MRLGYKMLVDARSSTESYALYSGDYDTQKIRFLSALLQNEEVFVDVGANVGFYTVPLAKRALSNGGKVYAFEPHPSNFGRLKQNVGFNGLNDAVVLSSFGLSCCSGEAELTMREDFLQGSETGNASIYIDDNADQAFNTVRVSLRALDDLYGSTLPRVDVVKVDIEGHEDLFMAGARNVIARERPIVMFEINKYYYRRRQVNLYENVVKVLPANYNIYMPRSSRKVRLSRVDHFDSLVCVQDFDSCADLDNAFLIPDEKVDAVLEILKTLQ